MYGRHQGGSVLRDLSPLRWVRFARSFPVGDAHVFRKPSLERAESDFTEDSREMADMQFRLEEDGMSLARYRSILIIDS